MEIDKKYVGMSEEHLKEELEISVYKDEECSEEVRYIDFGPIKPGEEKSEWYWIKNTGEAYIPEVYIGMGVINKRGWESRTDNYVGGPLEVGEICMVAFCLRVDNDVKPGNYSGSIPVTVYGPEHMY